jgi:DUF4097 and DUF4098 domain-containing protein YvlB
MFNGPTLQTPMRRHVHALTLALCAAMSSAPLFAATPINQTRPLDPRGTLEIDNLKGRIQVQAWDRNEVQVTGTLGKGVEKLVIEGDSDRLEVKVQYPERIGSWRGDRTEPTDLRLMVPLQANLEIDSVSADIDVDGVAPGELEIDTVSGNVTVAAAPVRASIESVSGDLRLTLNTGKASSESVSGDVHLSGRLDGEVKVETVSGDIRVDSRGERIHRLSTGTVSGDAEIRVALASGGQIRTETVSGDVRLHLPKNTSARLEGETFSGDLRAPDASIKREEFGPGATIRARYGSGAGEIHLESFSGDAILVLE